MVFMDLRRPFGLSLSKSMLLLMLRFDQLNANGIIQGCLPIRHASSPTGSSSTLLKICAAGTPAARSSASSVRTKVSGPAR